MINIAIIGTGAISDYHIDAYLAFLERCKITWISDVFLKKPNRRKRTKAWMRKLPHPTRNCWIKRT